MAVAVKRPDLLEAFFDANPQDVDYPVDISESLGDQYTFAFSQQFWIRRER
jgi:hypothetical protein